MHYWRAKRQSRHLAMAKVPMRSEFAQKCDSIPARPPLQPIRRRKVVAASENRSNVEKELEMRQRELLRNRHRWRWWEIFSRIMGRIQLISEVAGNWHHRRRLPPPT